jgi:cyclohexadieny/prephenate dehydrogenase
MSEATVERLALIGAGLIGSSIARAAREFGAAGACIIYDAAPDVRARVRELGIADAVEDNVPDAVRNADLAIICTPVGACGDIAKQMAAYLKAGAIVSDVGSVKEAVVAQVESHLPSHVHFVPAHPIAGTEFSGPDAGFASLFCNRWCILTPPTDVDVHAVDRLDAFWTRIGAKVERMSPAHHDKVLALTSHLPHLIAYNIVGTVDDFGEQTRSEVIKFSA